MKYLAVENAFSVEECLDIIADSMQTDLKPAYAPGMQIDPDIRSSMISFLYKSEEKYRWIFDRMWKIAKNHELGSMVGRLNFVQFAEYDSIYSGRFRPHRDTDNFYHPTNRVDFTRMLTCGIQLSDPHSYQGGDLNIYDTGGEIITAKKDRGCAILFPSNTTHEVTKVKAGIRYSLVAWFEGRRELV